MPSAWCSSSRGATTCAPCGGCRQWLHEMGEPLLYSRIDDAIRLFPEASLSTNGLVLTPEAVVVAEQLNLRELARYVERVACMARLRCGPPMS